MDNPHSGQRLLKILQSLTDLVGQTETYHWMVRPNETFDNRTPQQVIDDGEIELIEDMVYRLESGMPG